MYFVLSRLAKSAQTNEKRYHYKLGNIKRVRMNVQLYEKERWDNSILCKSECNVRQKHFPDILDHTFDRAET